MRLTAPSFLLASILLATAGPASAAELLTDNQMDNVSAGADISTTVNATASVDWDVTTDNDHDVTVDASVATSGTATVVADTSSVGAASSTTALTVTVNNN